MIKFPSLILAAAASIMISVSYAPAPAQAQDVNIFVDIPGFGRLLGYEYGGPALYFLPTRRSHR